ncbi:hypothetical protein G3I59_37405 [Amycolatopsis rubida]|uniref:Carboxymuconolactone decarboxylase-like domain-containing protein n=1 Tax=Amycolatopsis rubida TaxID=112413 RepID=A0ABX0C0C7_9PSEU|nr:MULTISPECIES: carboxymuconolactone decarboxylase family protein [Amycolatopsis]MYW96135.1 hypothetical protein [Amycolatopsis rubida]NEC61126.1 hypothetical protein [Amycolatopsis rubida]OAP23351.1 Carboxymuconolactone decarboxylase family protein [Amycolatopsis sp. M39]
MIVNDGKDNDLDTFAGLIADDEVVACLRDTSAGSFEAAASFWSVSNSTAHLTARMRELILLAMHATSTALNVDAIGRHLRRARAAGASDQDIVDVLITIVAVANHALYAAIPILEEEAERAGATGTSDPSLDAAFEAAKQDFISSRGFWNPDRELLARLMPEYFDALNGVSTESWKNGSLTAKEREFVCIGIDCTVTHSFPQGLRAHIRNALGHGANTQEILQIFQLAATMGLEGYLLAGRAMTKHPARA